MRDQEIIGLWEAYQQVHSQPQELTEEVEIAAQYFYEMGLNDEGVDILVEELGLGEFVEFVYDIVEEYTLTEARSGGSRIEPKLASGKEIKGKPKAASLKRLRAQKAGRNSAEERASAEKPSGMKASLQRQSAIAAAAKKQPKKPGFLDKVAGAVNRGIERHNKAMSELGKMKDATAVTAGKVRKAASEFKKGFTSEEIDLYDYLLEYLVAEGYADTNEAALSIMVNMSEDWREEIIDEAYQEPRFGKKDYIKKLSKRGGMGMGTPEDPHGYRDPKMAKVGAELSKRKTAAAKAKKTGQPDTYRAEKESQSKNR